MISSILLFKKNPLNKSKGFLQYRCYTLLLASISFYMPPLIRFRIILIGAAFFGAAAAFFGAAFLGAAFFAATAFLGAAFFGAAAAFLGAAFFGAAAAFLGAAFFGEDATFLGVGLLGGNVLEGGGGGSLPGGVGAWEPTLRFAPSLGLVAFAIS